MPRVKIDYVVSFSSEDPDNPASNLVSGEVSRRRWLCARGEPSCSVVLQLARAVTISCIQLGAHHAALVEVLAARSETPAEPYQVLVPSCVFVGPKESRSAEGVERVRSFEGAALAAAARQRFDRLRLVCSQPYNRHCKYGISFIHVFEPSPAAVPSPSAASPSALGRLVLAAADEEEFRPGELFAAHRQRAADTEAQIRQATTQALRNNPDAATKLMKTSLCKNKPTSAEPRDKSRDRDGAGRTRDRHGAGADTSAEPRDKSRDRDGAGRTRDRHGAGADASAEPRDKSRDRDGAGRTRDRHGAGADTSAESRDRDGPGLTRDRHGAGVDTSADGDAERRHRRRTEPVRGPRHTTQSREGDDTSCNNEPSGELCRRAEHDAASTSGKDDLRRKRTHSDRNGASAGAPLAGVVCVLSGYEGARRAELRSLALRLGAAVQREWGAHCTHLICAFGSTPKLRAVRAGAGGARAVAARGSWLEACARAARRVCWRPHASEPHLRTQPADTPPSDCDTDDEIEKVLRQQKKRRAASPSPAADDDDDDDDNDDVERLKGEKKPDDVESAEWSGSEGGDTDVEAAGGGGARGGGGALPALFAGRSFALAAAPLDARLLARYCAAYGGLVLAPSEVAGEADYVLCGGGGGGGGGGEGSGGARRVRADWVWACHAARALLPTQPYEL